MIFANLIIILQLTGVMNTTKGSQVSLTLDPIKQKFQVLTLDLAFVLSLIQQHLLMIVNIRKLLSLFNQENLDFGIGKLIVLMKLKNICKVFYWELTTWELNLFMEEVFTRNFTSMTHKWKSFLALVTMFNAMFLVYKLLI